MLRHNFSWHGAFISRRVLTGFWLPAGRAHFVEIKIPDGELSAAQKAVAAAVLLGGGRVAVVRTVEELLRCLDVWEIPRARRVAA
jgi:hypothetical protein